MDLLFEVITGLFIAEPPPSRRTLRLRNLTLFTSFISFFTLMAEIYLLKTSGAFGAVGFLLAVLLGVSTLVVAVMDRRLDKENSRVTK